MSMLVKRPNLFVVGAPKSGTTAMVEYLRQHPDVYFPVRKELGYFGSDLQYTTLSVRDKSHEEYLRHFADWTVEKCAGEGSVWYLFSTTAAKEIKEFSPDTKIVIMLRNPVDVMYSNYHQLLYNGNENLPTFEAALAAEADRKVSRRIPKTAMMISALYYRDSVKYAQQVKRYFDVFGRDNVHVIIYDDFKEDNAGSYTELLQFLEIENDFTPTFEIINPNKQVRNVHLLRTLKNPFFADLTHRFPKTAHIVNTFFRRLNTKYVSRPPMNADLRRSLLAECRSDIEKLGNLLERDLSHWYKQT